MKNRSLAVHVKSLPQEKKISIPVVISLIISVGALVVSVFSAGFTFIYQMSQEVAKPLPISSYSIIRGLGSFPSDHLLLPIEWVNEGGTPALVRQPILILEGREKPLYFFVAGEFADISEYSIRDDYIRSQSFLIDGHSARLINLVFHIENWWEPKDPSAYNFRFKDHEIFTVSIRFMDQNGDCYESNIGKFGTYSADELDRKIGYWWDTWPLELGHKLGQPQKEENITIDPRECQNQLKMN